MPRGVYERNPKTKTATTTKPTKPKHEEEPALSLSIRLPQLNGCAELKVRNGNGELMGTIVVESDGIRYRRPNQKAPADRKVTWSTLDKIMALGLV